MPEPSQNKSLVERALSPFADVRHGEAPSVLLMTLLMFLVLAAYYMLKTAREVFILTEGGAEVKSYSSAGQAVLLLALVPAYGAFASRVNRVRLVTSVTLFFAANLLLFLFAVQAGLRVGIVYFLWVGIFNLMVIAQFWAFAADLYTREQGSRLFPLIGVGSSLGAWLGSLRAGESDQSLRPRAAAHWRRRSPRALRAAGADHQSRDRAGREDAGRSPAEVPLGKEGGFALIFKDRYLMLIAVLTVLLNVVNTSRRVPLRPLRGRAVSRDLRRRCGRRSAREVFVGATYSKLFSTVNLVGFLLQMFVVSRIFKFLGVGKSLFIHPTVALIGYLMMLRAPSVQLMGWVKVADNSIDYSLGNTTKQALWLPTSREAKYKAKQAVDSFFVRRRRCDTGRRRVHGRAPAIDGARVCRHQPGARRRLARGRRPDQPDRHRPNPSAARKVPV